MVANACKRYEFNLNLLGVRKIVVFSLLGMVTAVNGSCMWKHRVYAPISFSKMGAFSPVTIKLSSSVATASETLKLTPSELQEFDSIMLELDPNQQLVKKLAQKRLSTIVNVTVGPEFDGLSHQRQTDIAIALRNGLSQICLCRPYLKFNTATGQPLAEIDPYLGWQ